MAAGQNDLAQPFFATLLGKFHGPENRRTRPYYRPRLEKDFIDWTNARQ